MKAGLLPGFRLPSPPQAGEGGDEALASSTAELL